jgi:tetraacyldisaccharide 4'-kinase
VLERLTASWYSLAPNTRWLPLSFLYGAVTAVRRALYRIGLLRSTKIERPVIVVGNLTVGGTGKTPLVIHIVEQLQRRGLKVAVVSRGYGGDARGVVTVTPHSDPLKVGDEPVLIAARTRCHVFVARDRVAAAQAAVADRADIIVSDDGLQHYALARDFEIVVVDGARGFGNGHLVPRGPLREPLGRLATVDCVVLNGAATASLPNFAPPLITMRLVPGDAHAVSGLGLARSLGSFRGSPLHAVAGIGNPQRFFAMLRAAGLDPCEHAFADHHAFSATELRFADGAPVLMTEKDAVKCRAFADERLWYVPVTAALSNDSLLDRIFVKLNGARASG